MGKRGQKDTTVESPFIFWQWPKSSDVKKSGCPAKVLRCVIIATETLPLCGSPVVFGISVRSTERANYKALSPVRAQIHTHTHTFFFF